MGQKQFQRGLTLIELMIVIVIVGILVAIAMPNFSAAQDRAKLASVKANVRTLQITVETYALDWGGIYPGSIPAITDTSDYKEIENPYTRVRGVSGTDGQGAWRTNDEGAANLADNALLNFNGEGGRSTAGLAMYIGLDKDQHATTRFLAADGSGSSNPTTGYLLYGCDGSGKAIRRFIVSNGPLTEAAKRLKRGR